MCNPERDFKAAKFYAAHSMLSLSPRQGHNPWSCILTCPLLKPRTALRHNQVTYALPLAVKIGTTFLKHSLAGFLKSKDVATFEPSFENSVPQKHTLAQRQRHKPVARSMPVIERIGNGPNSHPSAQRCQDACYTRLVITGKRIERDHEKSIYRRCLKC